MIEPFHKTISSGLGYKQKQLKFINADGGHMAYKRFFVLLPNSKKVYFVKGQDGKLFSDKQRMDHARQYLKKEHLLFKYLSANLYPNIPSETRLIEGNYLLMEGLIEQSGWYWRAPRDNSDLFAQYMNSVLNSFDALQKIPIPDDSHFFPKRIMDVFMVEGWNSLSEDNKVSQIYESAEKLRPKLYSETNEILDEAIKALTSLVPIGQAIYDTDKPLYLTHHDARQANIAWHPTHGTRNIDLSWMDVGWKNSDATMLLIDLAKTGHDINAYLNEYFNPEHAMLLMGHWFGRCAEPTRDGNPVVRLHQLASALTAYRLLKQTGYLA